MTGHHRDTRCPRRLPAILIILLLVPLLGACEGRWVPYTKDVRLNTTFQIYENDVFQVTEVFSLDDLARAIDDIPDNADITDVYVSFLDARVEVQSGNTAPGMKVAIVLDDLRDGQGDFLVREGKDILFDQATLELLNNNDFLGIREIAIEEVRQQINNFVRGGAEPRIAVSIMGMPHKGVVKMDLHFSVGMTVTYQVCEDVGGPAAATGLASCTTDPDLGDIF